MSARGPIVFFGTPRFAVPTLAAMDASGWRPDLVVTQPSRPVGRGRRLELPPVGRWARAHEVEFWQIERVRDAGFLERLAERRPWIAVVVAFGQIFPRRLLDLPERGCVNLHASLLPRHRGAAPVQAALAAGDEVTGVTTMRMTRGLDSGPIYLTRELEILPRENAAELGERLAAVGGELVVETLRGLARGELEAREQPEAGVTHAPKIRKEDGRVDWRRSARTLASLYRAYTPWPGLTSRLRGRPVKLLDVTVAGDSAASTASGAPRAGAYRGLSGAGILVECGDGSLVAVGGLQRPGRRALAAEQFVNGERLAVGEVFEAWVAESATGAAGE